MAAQNEPHEAPAIRAFGIALETRRSAAALSKNGFAEKLGYTPQYIGQIEAAKNTPSQTFAQDLDTFFGSDDMFARLRKLITETRHLAILPPGFHEYAELERQAAEIRKFEALLVTGLLQTEAYARAVMGSLIGPDALDGAVAARMARQEALSRADPPHLFLVLDEWVLKRVVGDPEIMRQQLAHLLEMGERPHIHINVLPHDTEHYVAFSGSFTLLKAKGRPEAAYIEAAGQGNLIEEPHAVADCAVRYDLVRGYAHNVPESRKLIETAMESL